MAGAGGDRRWPVLVVLVVLVAATQLPACGSGGKKPASPSPGPGITLDTGSSASATVGASGGSIVTPSGHKLVFPAGALASDTVVKVTPLLFPPGAQVLGGAEFEPDGLQLQKPATWTVKLATAMPPGLELRLGHALSRDAPRNLYDVGALFKVDASGTTATGVLESFSSAGVQLNCHGWTRRFLLDAWKNVPGRTPRDISFISGVPEDQLGACLFGADPLQTVILKRYFHPCGEFRSGVPFDQAAKDKIKSELVAGNMVVFLFGTLLTAHGDGTYDNVGHSGVGVLVGGNVRIRNSFQWTEDTEAKIVNANPAFHPANPTDQFSFEWSLAEIDATPPARLPDGTYRGLRDLRRNELVTLLITTQCMQKARDEEAIEYPHVLVYCSDPIVPGGTGGGGGGGTGGGGTGGGGTGGTCTTAPPQGTCTSPQRPLDCGFGCCPDGMPYHCLATNACYPTEREAAAACSGGLGCTTCARSVPVPDGDYSGSLGFTCPGDTLPTSYRLTLTVDGSSIDGSIERSPVTASAVGTLTGGRQASITFNPTGEHGTRLTYSLTGTYDASTLPPFFTGGVSAQREQWDGTKVTGVTACSGSWSATRQ